MTIDVEIARADYNQVVVQHITPWHLRDVARALNEAAAVLACGATRAELNEDFANHKDHRIKITDTFYARIRCTADIDEETRIVSNIVIAEEETRG